MSEKLAGIIMRDVMTRQRKNQNIVMVLEGSREQPLVGNMALRIAYQLKNKPKVVFNVEELLEATKKAKKGENIYFIDNSKNKGEKK